MPQVNGQLQIAQAVAGAAGEPVTGLHASQEHREEPYKLGDIPKPQLVFANALLVAFIMIVFAIVSTRKMAAIPRGAQSLAEFIVEVMVNFTRGIIGPGGEKYVPLIGTLFFFIYLSNLIGLVPGFHSPTANISTPLAIGLIVVVYAQYVGIRERGIIGYIRHFMGPMPILAPLLMPIEVISEAVKPFTLSMRIFGNIFGEDTVIMVLSSLGVAFLAYVPIQFPIMILALLTTFVQALVYTLLAAIYIVLQSHHEEEEGAHASGQHAVH